jgi:hypothetical protein
VQISNLLYRNHFSEDKLLDYSISHVMVQYRRFNILDRFAASVSKLDAK